MFVRISWYGKRLKHTPNPVYLGVTLDRSLTYKNHIANTKAKVGARNSILKKLANTNWGTDARTIRTTALALCFSAAEYASPVWSRSAHAPKIDPALNSSCRAMTGCLRPTKVEDIYSTCSAVLPLHTSEGWSCPRKKRTNKKTIHSTHSSNNSQWASGSNPDTAFCTR